MMKSSSPSRHVWNWSRRIAAEDEDAWRDRLAFLGPDKIAVHGRPGLRTVRIEAYSETAAALRRAIREFGGKLEKLDVQKLAARAAAPRKPLRLSADFAVMDAHGNWPSKRPLPRVLLRIGGSMAFGTGEHATTASCLRILRHEASRFGSGWAALDIGTGTGILAIASEKLGASRVNAFDNDPRAVRAAQANVRLNHCKRVSVKCADLFLWNPSRRYPVVMANVFSEILRANAARIVRAVGPGGCLVLSGILRAQEAETAAAFTSRGLRIDQTKRRGKWSTVVLRRTGSPSHRRRNVS